MAVPKIVSELIERFERNYDTYKNPAYNETQVRREFLDPFFEALGWDVFNKQGHAEAYKDIIHEDAIKVGSATKAPDYSFRIGGTRKFFVEAKKPSIYLKEHPEPAYQLRRYAWSAKLPLSILTDFEEFVVYDCRKKPINGDKASVSRLLYYTFREYEEKWDEIACIFSREAVLKGSFDKYAETRKGKRGTSEVDCAFLAEIESWRELLARNLAQRNPELSQKELNFAIQRIIDRIIFLRMCEDRGVEDYGTLQHLLDDSPIYDGLKKKFRDADDRYNSGLFHFTAERNRAEAPDTLTPKLKIDDKTLKQIIGHLYYPESPYEFSVLSPEILGQVYEQFLGKVIRLTANHQAKVEDKPEVRKAGGVYYTPTYIVDYIVKNTVGTLLEGKTPKEAAKLRILDPACGSGSFLVGAYQYLLNWHRDWYLENEPASNGIYQGKGGMWYLTPDVKQKILLNNIYGVDIDTQAVEVTKLSLLLKVLEDESKETLDKRRRLFHERALPDLGSNIKCGNSLIGPDFYDGHQGKLFDDDTREKINAFDWYSEFPKIMKASGFNAVIGNPPYVNAWDLYEAMPEVRDLINEKEYFATADRHWDLYVLFLERAMTITSREGLFSFIIPFSYSIQKYGQASRKLLLEKLTLESVADLRSVRVFHPVPVITIIPVFNHSKPRKDHRIQVVKPSEDSTKTRVASFIESHTVSQSGLIAQHESMIRLDMSDKVASMVAKVEQVSIPIEQLCYINYGAQMSSKAKGVFGKDHVIRASKKNMHCKPMISGRELYRYQTNWIGRYVDWSFAPEMYGSRWPEFFERPKLMIRDITGTHRIESSLDQSGLYCDHTVLCAQRKCEAVPFRSFEDKEVQLSTTYDPRYLQGLVASSLMSAYYYFVLTGEGVRIGGGFHTYPHTIRRFPIKKINFSRESEKKEHDRMVKLVDRMLDLHKKKPHAKTPQEITRLERDITATDKEIDQLVYELYGLTKDEIKIVEESTQ